MSPDLLFALQFYRGDVFIAFLLEGVEGAGLHGSYLVDLLGGTYYDRYKSGLSDNNYAADKLLQAAKDSGWITRGERRPGLSQAAFIGVEHRREINGEPSYTYPREYVWHLAPDITRIFLEQFQTIFRDERRV